MQLNLSALNGIKKNAPSPSAEGDERLSEFPQRLGDYLVSKGLIDKKALHSALKTQQVTGDKLGKILVRGGFLPNRELIPAILTLNKSKIAEERVSRSRVPAKILDEYSIIITSETDTQIFVGTTSDEYEVKGIIREYYPEKEVVFVAFIADNANDFIDEMSKSSDELSGQEVSSEEVLDKIISNALITGSSDIHIEPRPNSYSVLYRRLGVREHTYEGSVDEYLTVLAQVKDRAKLDLAEKRIPQDGGFGVEHNGKLIDLRVATLPEKNGEKAVLRVLDPDRVQPRLANLGISRLDHWRRGTNRLHGISFICGATGSGKTTTLNATIREMDRFGRAIYTIEDPVEYGIAYVTQISVNPLVGLTFARALRALMRADPCVIILGEIRDEETAAIAVQAAVTGHMVLATLHTGSILGALDRIRDLGVPARDLRDILRGVLVQQLIRTKCPACLGNGCVACHSSGYADRTIVSECQEFTSPEEFDRAMNRDPFWPLMIDDAMAKLDAGITTDEEIRRVFGSEVDNWRSR